MDATGICQCSLLHGVSGAPADYNVHRHLTVSRSRHGGDLRDDGLRLIGYSPANYTKEEKQVVADSIAAVGKFFDKLLVHLPFCVWHGPAVEDFLPESKDSSVDGEQVLVGTVFAAGSKVGQAGVVEKAGQGGAGNLPQLRQTLLIGAGIPIWTHHAPHERKT